jgi:Carbohydrate binding domain
MSNKILQFAAILAFAVTVALADDKPKADRTAKNLVTNGNMEDVADGKPAKWGIVAADGGKIDLASSAEQPKEGKRCMLLKGSAEWGVAYSEKVPLDRKKTFTLTGFAWAKSGTARIKIDYYQGDTYLGMTESDDVTEDKWQQLEVVAEPDKFPDATHILACAVVFGEFEASFDDFVMTAKEGK